MRVAELKTNVSIDNSVIKMTEYQQVSWERRGAWTLAGEGRGLRVGTPPPPHPAKSKIIIHVGGLFSPYVGPFVGMGWFCPPPPYKKLYLCPWGVDGE